MLLVYVLGRKKDNHELWVGNEIPYYSNPNVVHEGYALGVSFEDTNSSDVSRAFFNNRYIASRLIKEVKSRLIRLNAPLGRAIALRSYNRESPLASGNLLI